MRPVNRSSLSSRAWRADCVASSATPELREHHALEGQAERAEERLARLVGGLASLARKLERAARGLLSLARPRSSRQRSHGPAFSSPTSRARWSSSTSASRDRACSSIQIQCSASDASGWSRTRSSVAELCNASARSAVGRRRGPAEHRLGRQPHHEHVSGQRLVTELVGESQGDVGVPQRLVEALEHPNAVGGGPFVGERECPAIVARLLDHLREQPLRLGGRLVELDARKRHHRARPQRAGLERSDDVTKLRLGAAGVTGLEVQPCCLDRSPHDVFTTICGRQLCRAVEQQRGRPWRSERTDSPRRLLENGSDRLVRLVDGGSQLPRARLRPFEQLCEPRVHLGAPERIRRLVRAGREQWMREPHALPVERHDASLERRTAGPRRRGSRTQPR